MENPLTWKASKSSHCGSKVCLKPMTLGSLSISLLSNRNRTRSDSFAPTDTRVKVGPRVRVRGGMPIYLWPKKLRVTIGIEAINPDVGSAVINCHFPSVAASSQHGL